MDSKQPNGTSKVTLADIARDCGVSVATVSLVLRNKSGVGSETRQRVYDSARALGYIQKVSNQARVHGLPRNIGLIVKVMPNGSPTTNSFYGPVLAGIEAVCRHGQINLVYATLPVDPGNHPLEIPRLLLEQHVDGVLMVGMCLDTKIVQMLRSQDLPVVLVDAYAVDDPFDSVVIENYAGAYRAVMHLIEAGHRQIAIVGSSPESYPSIMERRKGYFQALSDKGLEPIFGDCPLYPDEVLPVIPDLLNTHPGVTGILACNDDVAIATIRMAQKLGRRVPENLSVIGFDDILLAQHVMPPLTTMGVDMMGMGRLAAQLLLNRFAFPEAGGVRAVIRPKLVLRESVQPVR
ncbi:MAG: LacI family DNA-binding transcriptional regulator [Anaerolineae bacterium]|nr:LacI family DNA-binding transcriptional regulator [Anaerolineae bacterium]